MDNENETELEVQDLKCDKIDVPGCQQKMIRQIQYSTQHSLLHMANHF